MKKLQLKSFKLGATEVLTREQLKNVLGGIANTMAINQISQCGAICGYVGTTAPVQICVKGCKCVIINVGSDTGLCKPNV